MDHMSGNFPMTLLPLTHTNTHTHTSVHPSIQSPSVSAILRTICQSQSVYAIILSATFHPAYIIISSTSLFLVEIPLLTQVAHTSTATNSVWLIQSTLYLFNSSCFLSADGWGWSGPHLSRRYALPLQRETVSNETVLRNSWRYPPLRRRLSDSLLHCRWQIN